MKILRKPLMAVNKRSGPLEKTDYNREDLSLHMLAAQGETKLMEEKLHFTWCDCKDENGLTPLMWAAYYGQLETVKFLLAMGCDVNETAELGETALGLAASQGHKSIMDQLLTVNSCQIDGLCDFHGNTALMTAAASGHFGCVEILLNAGAAMHLQNTTGQTALHLAVRNKHDLIVKYIENYLITGLLGES